MHTVNDSMLYQRPAKKSVDDVAKEKTQKKERHRVVVYLTTCLSVLYITWCLLWQSFTSIWQSTSGSWYPSDLTHCLVVVRCLEDRKERDNDVFFSPPEHWVSNVNAATTPSVVLKVNDYDLFESFLASSSS